jgi:hypothetical protein
MDQDDSDAALAASVAKLWPHREHESGPVRGLLCRIGIHRWRQIPLAELIPARRIHFCFWCSCIRIDATIYDP